MGDWIDEALKIAEQARMQRASLVLQRRDVVATLERIDAALAILGGLELSEVPSPRVVNRRKKKGRL